MYKPKTEDMQGNRVNNERHPLMMARETGGNENVPLGLVFFPPLIGKFLPRIRNDRSDYYIQGINY